MNLLLQKFFIVISAFCIPLMTYGVTNNSNSLQKQFANLEASSGGRLGIYAISTANNDFIQYRDEERFPFGSTAKVIGVAAILKQSMADENYMRQRITYKKNDLAG